MMNNKELLIQRLRNTGFEDDIINEFIADFGDDNLNQPIYLVDFEGKKALVPESFLKEVE